METARPLLYRRPRPLYAVGIACIVLGALILFQSRIRSSPADPGGATTTVAGLVVTLRPTTAAVGPTALTVEVRDAGGGPVAGATVTIRARSAEMEMGTVEAMAPATEPGRYVAEGVPFGMGGAWSVGVTIALPGRVPATADFTLDVADARQSVGAARQT